MSLFTFDPSVPAASNNPSADQSPMLQNNLSTQQIIGVDHITFNNTGGGEHAQITFNQSEGPFVPAPPVNPPELFTNTMDGIGTILADPQLFYYSGDASKTQQQYQTVSNGSTMLLGGMILKWGFSGNTGTPTTFISAFPNNCFAVIITGTNPAYLGSFIATVVGVASFTAVRTNGTGSTGFYYFAIGN